MAGGGRQSAQGGGRRFLQEWTQRSRLVQKGFHVRRKDIRSGYECDETIDQGFRRQLGGMIDRKRKLKTMSGGDKLKNGILHKMDSVVFAHNLGVRSKVHITVTPYLDHVIAISQ